MGVWGNGVDYAGREKDHRTVGERIVQTIGVEDELTTVDIGQMKEIVGVGL